MATFGSDDYWRVDYVMSSISMDMKQSGMLLESLLECDVEKANYIGLTLVIKTMHWN